MRGINKVILLGNVVFPADPEKYPAAGYVRFDLAVTSATLDGGEVINQIPCLASGKLAEVINQFATEGRSIYLEGKLRPFKDILVVEIDTLQLLQVSA